MTRVWIDTDIGTNPDDATAVLFALLHPNIDVAGISISGTQQERRREEARAVLEYAHHDVDVFLSSELKASDIDRADIEHTIALGPLTNIARLILDEASIGKLHAMLGVFQRMNYRDNEISTERNARSDKEATRIALSQHNNVSLSPMDVTTSLALSGHYRNSVEEEQPFLKARYVGYEQHLHQKFGPSHAQIILHDLFPVCDVLNIPTISREVVEFYIQPDGSFRCPYALSGVVQSIEEVKENPDSLPVPLVKHEVIRSVQSDRIFQEILKVLAPSYDS